MKKFFKRSWTMTWAIALLLIIAGCGYFLTDQQKAVIAALTPDQKARLAIDGMQSQLERDFDSCKMYVDKSTDPAVKTVWKAQVVPAFDKANRSLGSMIAAGGLISGTVSGNMTPDQVYAQMAPLLQNVVAQLVAIGFKRK